MLRLKELRVRDGVSQQVLADEMMVSRSAVAMWERGTEPSNEMLQKLADYFGVSVDYLLGRDESAKTEQPTVKDDELRQEVIELLNGLSPADFQRMKDFAAGLKSSRVK